MTRLPSKHVSGVKPPVTGLGSKQGLYHALRSTVDAGGQVVHRGVSAAARQAGVALVPGSAFELPGHLRIVLSRSRR